MINQVRENYFNGRPLGKVKNQSLINITAFLFVPLWLTVASPVVAVPLTVGSFTIMSKVGACDPLPPLPTHELGVGGVFVMQDEDISVSSSENIRTPCLARPDDPLMANIQVEITNNTDIEWKDLLFVADTGVGFQNFDGLCNGELCFKIDDVGGNTPLFFASEPLNPNFEPGEFWIFDIQDWTLFPLLPIIASVGVPSPGPLLVSNASIVATPCIDGPASLGGCLEIPEPPTFTLFAIGFLGIGFIAWRRNTTRIRSLLYSPS